MSDRIFTYFSAKALSIICFTDSYGRAPFIGNFFPLFVTTKE